jgi:hypothetical protein
VLSTIIGGAAGRIKDAMLILVVEAALIRISIALIDFTIIYGRPQNKLESGGDSSQSSLCLKQSFRIETHTYFLLQYVTKMSQNG